MMVMIIIVQRRRDNLTHGIVVTNEDVVLRSTVQVPTKLGTGVHARICSQFEDE